MSKRILTQQLYLSYYMYNEEEDIQHPRLFNFVYLRSNDVDESTYK